MKLINLQALKRKCNELTPQVKATIGFTICNMLHKIVAFLCTPIYTRYLSAEQYGVLSLFQSWMNILTVFLTLNLFYSSYMAGLTLYQEDEEEYTVSNIGLVFFISIIGFIIIYACKDTVANTFSLPYKYVFVMVVEIFFTAIFLFWSSRERYYYRVKALLVATFFSTVLNAAISVGFMVIVPQEYRLDVKIYSAALVMVLAGLYCFKRIYRLELRLVNLFYWKILLKRNVPLIPHYLSGVILGQADRIMIDRLEGTEETAYYSLAYSISMMMIVVTGAIKNAVDPILYQAIKKNKTDYIPGLVTALFVFVAFVCCIAIMFAPEIIYLLAPFEYFDAINAIPPIALSVFFIFSYNMFSVVGFYYGKSWVMTFVSLIGAIVNVLLNLWLIPVFGYIAAGYTTLICYMIFSISHLFVAEVQMKKNGITRLFDIKTYLCISVFVILIGNVISQLYRFVFLRFLISIACCVVITMNKNMRSIMRKILVKGEKSDVESSENRNK